MPPGFQRRLAGVEKLPAWERHCRTGIGRVRCARKSHVARRGALGSTAASTDVVPRMTGEAFSATEDLGRGDSRRVGPDSLAKDCSQEEYTALAVVGVSRVRGTPQTASRPSVGRQDPVEGRSRKVSPTMRTTRYLIIWWMSQTPYAAVFKDQAEAEIAAKVRNAVMVTVSGEDVAIDRVADWFRRDEAGGPMPAEWRDLMGQLPFLEEARRSVGSL